MKKLLSVFAIGAFVGCGSNNDSDKDVNIVSSDTTSNMNDTTTMITDTGGRTSNTDTSRNAPDTSGSTK